MASTAATDYDEAAVPRPFAKAGNLAFPEVLFVLLFLFFCLAVLVVPQQRLKL